MGDGVYVPAPRGGVGRTITVLDHEEWFGQEAHYPETRVVICDCSPNFDSNPIDLVKQFDYCIIPTTLNPLGINKNLHVIEQTFRQIREANREAELFLLINGLHTDRSHENRNKELSAMISRRLGDVTSQDPRVHYIDPIGNEERDGIAIRFSTLLSYWGYEHLIHGKEARLPFDHVAGRCHPREDFLRLAGHIEELTELRQLKKTRS